jgi:hypothetical protein
VRQAPGGRLLLLVFIIIILSVRFGLFPNLESGVNGEQLTGLVILRILCLRLGISFIVARIIHFFTVIITIWEMDGNQNDMNWPVVKTRSEWLDFRNSSQLLYLCTHVRIWQ